MNSIRKIIFSNDTMNTVTIKLGENARCEQLARMGFRTDDGMITAFIVVNHAEKPDNWADIVDNGIKTSLGVYEPAEFSASGVRLCESIWILREANTRRGNILVRKAYEEWAYCGLINEDFNKVDGRKGLNVHKAINYIGSLLGSTGCHVECMELPEGIPAAIAEQMRTVGDRINDFVVAKPVVWAKSCMMDVLDPTKAENNVVRKMTTDEQKADDGTAWLFIDDEVLSDEDKEWLYANLDKIEDFTARLPWCKGLFQWKLKSAVRKFCESNNWNGDFKDCWKIDRNIICASGVLFTNVFKAWEAYGAAAERLGYEDPWKLYCDKVSEYGHSMWCCVQPHITWKPLPYQMVQSLPMTNEEIDFFSIREEKKLFGCFESTEAAISLLPAQLREIAKRGHHWLNHPYFQYKMAQSFYGRVKKTCQGMLSHMGKYTFIATDTVALLNGIRLGDQLNMHKTEEGMTLLSEKESFCRVVEDYNYEEEVKAYYENRKPHLLKKFAIGRNPGCANDMQVLTLKDVPAEYAGLYLGHTCFVSPWSFQNLTLMDDYDGDKVIIVLNKRFVFIVERSHIEYDDVPFQYPGAAAPAFIAPSDEAVKDVIKKMAPAMIGIPALGMVKVWAHYGYRPDMLAAGAEGYNNGVDNAKYGGVDSVASQAFNERMKNVKLPACYAFRKSKTGDFGREFIENLEKCQETNGTLDRITKRIRDRILADYTEFKLELFDEGVVPKFAWDTCEDFCPDLFDFDIANTRVVGKVASYLKTALTEYNGDLKQLAGKFNTIAKMKLEDAHEEACQRKYAERETYADIKRKVLDICDGDEVMAYHAMHHYIFASGDHQGHGDKFLVNNDTMVYDMFFTMWEDFFTNWAFGEEYTGERHDIEEWYDDDCSDEDYEG